MKTITTFLFLCFTFLAVNGQSQLGLSIKSGSDAPNYEKEHLYLMEATNASGKAMSFSISIENKECQSLKKSELTELDHQLLDANKNGIEQMTVQSGRSIEFYVKLSRPLNARLNTWNCTEIVAVDQNGKPLSNAITIESLIPNPSNNN